MARAQQTIVTGFPELDRKLKNLPLALQKKLVRKAIRKSSKDITLADAKRDVPVKTGKLRSTLTVRALTRRRGRVGAKVTTKDGQYEGGQFAGAFLEYGTKERFRKPIETIRDGEIDVKGASTGQIEKGKFGYMRRAIYDNEKKIKQLFIDDVLELIREAAAGPVK